MIKSERYLEQIRPFYDYNLIKIITGIIGCGKSIILKQIHEEISKISSNTIRSTIFTFQNKIKLR